MSEPTAREKPDFIEKIADYAGWILAVSVAVIIIVWSFYFFRFRGGLSDDTAIWGQFGDFVGGTLNSVFAFFSFMILISSLRLQLKELRLTREELEATRKELAASSAAQKMQAEHFDKEARKNDHSSSINYMVNELKLGPGKFNIELKEVGIYNSPRVISISEHDYPENNALGISKIKNQERVEYIINESKKYRILDYHCYKLYVEFPNSPMLINCAKHYQSTALSLLQKEWITELKFFGKHDLPFS